MNTRNKIKAYFDTETTGVNLFNDRIISMGVVIAQGDKILEEKYWEFNPEKASEFEAYQVHKLSDQYLKTQKKFKEIYKEVLDVFFKHNVETLVAYNADFDVCMLSHELNLLRSSGIDIDKYIKETYPDFYPNKYRDYFYDKNQNHYDFNGLKNSELTNKERLNIADWFQVEDTMLFTASLGIKDIKLDTLAEHLNIAKDNETFKNRQLAHNALGDAIILKECSDAIVQKYLNGIDFIDTQLEFSGLRFKDKIVISEEQKVSQELSKMAENVFNNMMNKNNNYEKTVSLETTTVSNSNTM